MQGACKTERPKEFASWNQKESSWQQLEHQAPELRHTCLHRQIQGNDNCAGEAHCHKPCHDKFHVTYNNHILSILRKEKAKCPTPDTEQESKLLLMLQLLTKWWKSSTNMLLNIKDNAAFITLAHNSGCGLSFLELKSRQFCENILFRKVKNPEQHLPGPHFTISWVPLEHFQGLPGPIAPTEGGLETVWGAPDLGPQLRAQLWSMVVSCFLW